MLPITETPPLVADSAEHFHSVFSWHQNRHFQRYLTGLMTDPNVTVSHMAGRFSEQVSQRGLNRFLTEYVWSLEELNRQRLRMLQESPGTRWKPNGVVGIDDTLVDKSGKLIPGAGKFYDHVDSCYKHAQCIVTSHYADWQVNYPLGFRQYFKEDSKEAKEFGFKTKIRLACELVTESVELEVAADTYVADSLYLCKEFADHVESHDKNWLMAGKSDLLVRVNRDWIQLKDYAVSVPVEQYRMCEAGGKKYWVHTRTLFLKCLGREVKVAVSYDNEKLEGDPKFLITNKLRWERNRILRTYCLRHPVDAFYRDAKQHLGLEGCQLRTIESVHRHWILVFTAYSILKRCVVESSLTKRLKGALNTLGDGCRYVACQLLESLVMLVYQLAIRKQTPKEIMKVITM
jgi:hypothetical protein